MYVHLLTFSVIFSTVTCLQTPSTEDFYYAAVVEYNPIIGKGGNDTLNANAQQYIRIIEEASKYADIVVFPEAALLRGSNVTVVIPFGSGTTTAPADDQSLHPDFRSLSQAARNHSIYVAINIHEEFHADNETYLYNTNVVFDRSGSIVARYRKYNLFSEKLNITKEPEHSYFDTDFGVRFGTFTCFDILFKEPTLKLKDYNVTDYIFPTWWFSELPLLTAVQEQAAWAYATDSNLLAAGGNTVRVGSSGSGIYSGKNGAVIYRLSNRDETAILTAKIYKKGRNGTSTGQIVDFGAKGTLSTLRMKTESSLQYYTTRQLISDINFTNTDTISKNNFTVEEEICQGGFCCHFYVDATTVYKNKTDASILLEKSDRFNNYEYRLAVFNGVRSFDGFASGGLQVCAIISCLNMSQSSCGKTTKNEPLMTVGNNIYKYTTIFNQVVIKTSTLDKEASVLPNILEASEGTQTFGSLMSTSKFKFYHKGSTAELRLSSEKLGTSGIFARVFSRDGSKPGVNSSPTYSKFSTTCLLMFVLCITYCCW